MIREIESVRNMKKWLSKLSIFQKIILIISLTIAISLRITNNFTEKTITNIVTKQIYEGNISTLSSSSAQISDKINRNVSLIRALSTDSQVKEYLQEVPRSDYENINIINKMNEIILNYVYNMFDTETMIAIISSKDDVYANWEMQNQETLINLKNEYLRYHNKGQDKEYTLYTKMELDISLSSNKTFKNKFTMALPIYSNKSENNILGVAIVFIEEENLYDAISFKVDEQHTTVLIDKSNNIISAKDKTLIGKQVEVAFNFVKNKSSKGYYADKEGKMIITQKQVNKSKFTIIDIMKVQYVQEQVDLVMRNVQIINILTIIIIIIVCYFTLRGITKPLKRLTEQMVTQDYSTFEQDNQNLGKNEVRLLEKSFQVMKYDIEELIKENKLKEEEKRKTEIKALQSQIKPHFLFNTLNAIRCTIINNNNDKAADLVYKLAMLLRMTLVKGDALITLKEELETIGYYLDILIMRHGTQIDYQIDISPLAEEVLVPKLFLQPLVENSVVHGFSQQNIDATIKIKTIFVDNFLVIQVMDNGKGIEEDIDMIKSDIQYENEFSGIGLMNVNSRLKLYFGKESGLKIYSKNGWTISEVWIHQHR